MEKEEIFSELKTAAKKDKTVSESIKEIADQTGISEELILKSFITIEIEKERNRQNDLTQIKKSMKEQV